MAREYFCAYHSYLKAMRNLSDAECGRLFRALLQYSAGETLINLQGREGVAFDFMTEQIDRDNAAYEEKCQKNSSNIKKRYDRIRSNTDAYDRIESNTTAYETYQGKGEGEGKGKEECSFLAETRKEPKEFPSASARKEKTRLVALGCGKTSAPPTPIREGIDPRAGPGNTGEHWDHERQRWIGG